MLDSAHGMNINWEGTVWRAALQKEIWGCCLVASSLRVIYFSCYRKSPLTFIQGAVNKKNQPNQNPPLLFQTKNHLPSQELSKNPASLWVRNVKNNLIMKKKIKTSCFKTWLLATGRMSYFGTLMLPLGKLTILCGE